MHVPSYSHPFLKPVRTISSSVLILAELLSDLNVGNFCPLVLQRSAAVAGWNWQMNITTVNGTMTETTQQLTYN